MIARLLLALLTLFSTRALAQTSNYVLIVSSASGSPEFKEKFWGWSSQLVQILRDEMKIPKEQISLLTEDPAMGPELASGKSTKTEMIKALESLQSKVKAEARLFIFLIGHANFDGSDYKFNLVGPDITGSELKTYLDRFRSEVVLVSTTSCSGVLTKTLSKKGRVIITATKSEFETNDTMFAQFFVEAFKNKAADIDKNSAVSVLEAYLYAAQKVDGWYKEKGRLATEHPLLEDNGDATGTSQPSPANGEGLLAGKISLPEIVVARGPNGATPSDPELQSLYASKQKLETAIQELKYKKSTLPDAEYSKQMETLLIQLAQTNQKINAKRK
jgi:hypothetical protein